MSEAYKKIQTHICMRIRPSYSTVINVKKTHIIKIERKKRKIPSSSSSSSSFQFPLTVNFSPPYTYVASRVIYLCEQELTRK